MGGYADVGYSVGSHSMEPVRLQNVGASYRATYSTRLLPTAQAGLDAGRDTLRATRCRYGLVATLMLRDECLALMLGAFIATVLWYSIPV